MCFMTKLYHNIQVFNPISDRAEKSAEAFREQKFKEMCVPGVSDQLQPLFPILRSYLTFTLYVIIYHLMCSIPRFLIPRETFLIRCNDS